MEVLKGSKLNVTYINPFFFLCVIKKCSYDLIPTGINKRNIWYKERLDNSNSK